MAQMRVSGGRAYSFSLAARIPEEPERVHLPVSFDQQRHVSFGSRPGSWMAVAFSLPHPVDREVIGRAWQHVIARHGTLRSVFLPAQTAATHGESGAVDTLPSRAGELDLVQAQLGDGTWEALGKTVGETARDTAGENAGSTMSPDQVRAALRAHFDQVCEPFAAPSHRLCLIEPENARPDQNSHTQDDDAPPQVIIGSDHSHVDAWSLLVLARDLSSCVEDLVSGREPGADLPEAEAFQEHTLMLQRRPEAPVGVVARWRDILDAGGGTMPRFPLDLGDLSSPVPEVVEIRDVFDAEELETVEAFAAQRGVRLIAVAVAVMTRLADELVGQPLRAVFPVHSRDDPRWFGSVGWFITNSVIENSSADYAGSYQAVKEAIKLGSYPLEPIMKPYGGMPQDAGMFAMSWLDHRKLPVNVDEQMDPQHVSAVIETDGVMIWFVVNHTGMHLRCRYPDNRQARRSMRTWLAGLVYGLRAPLEHPQEWVKAEH